MLHLRRRRAPVPVDHRKVHRSSPVELDDGVDPRSHRGRPARVDAADDELVEHRELRLGKADRDLLRGHGDSIPIRYAGWDGTAHQSARPEVGAAGVMPTGMLRA